MDLEDKRREIVRRRALKAAGSSPETAPQPEPQPPEQPQPESERPNG